MHLLHVLTRQWADHALTFFLIDTAQHDDLAACLLQQVSDIATDGNDGDVFLLGQGAGQQGVATAVLNKDRFAIVH